MTQARDRHDMPARLSETRTDPSFTIEAVSRATGLTPHAIRVWERRYGLPRPERTPGRQRLYSTRDIQTLKWLVARQEEGMRISRAVDHWRQLIAAGQDPLEPPKPSAASAERPHRLDELRQRWIDACLVFDEQLAEGAVSEAFAIFPLELVCSALLGEGLAHLGHAWSRGEVSVQQEHFASGLVARRLADLIAVTPPPLRAERILAACPPGEEHSLPAQFLTLFLRRRGWNVIFLGANVPLERLDTSVAQIRPALIALFAQQLHTAATLREAAEALGPLSVSVGFAGYVFEQIPGLGSKIPGHYLGQNPEQAVERIETLIASSPPADTVEPLAPRYQAALDHFRERRPLVEARMWERLQGKGISPQDTALASDALGRTLAAALALGDLNLAGRTLQELAERVVPLGLAEHLLPLYLSAYAAVARDTLDQRATMLTDWLALLPGVSQ